MLRLQINGKIQSVGTPSIEAILEAEAVPREDWGAIAVAKNGEVIPKSAWSQTPLNENDRIDIVWPFAGG